MSPITHGLLSYLVAESARLSRRDRALVTVAGLAFFAVHLHYFCDLIGARGPDGAQWPLPYLAPFDRNLELTWSGQWALNGWPNFVITAAAMAAVFYLAWRCGYSPVGLLSERADAAFVNTLRTRFPLL
jgi:membrane-bound metal-dependent hydrolase YbcI (DUF457 family)